MSLVQSSCVFLLATIAALTLVLQLGLERDADVVMNFYDSVHGGTAGGWSPDMEEALRVNIRKGYAVCVCVRDCACVCVCVRVCL